MSCNYHQCKQLRIWHCKQHPNMPWDTFTFCEMVVYLDILPGQVKHISFYYTAFRRFTSNTCMAEILLQHGADTKTISPLGSGIILKDTNKKQLAAKEVWSDIYLGESNTFVFTLLHEGAYLATRANVPLETTCVQLLYLALISSLITYLGL